MEGEGGGRGDEDEFFLIQNMQAVMKKGEKTCIMTMQLSTTPYCVCIAWQAGTVNITLAV